MLHILTIDTAQLSRVSVSFMQFCFTSITAVPILEFCSSDITVPGSASPHLRCYFYLFFSWIMLAQGFSVLPVFEKEGFCFQKWHTLNSVFYFLDFWHLLVFFSFTFSCLLIQALQLPSTLSVGCWVLFLVFYISGRWIWMLYVNSLLGNDWLAFHKFWHRTFSFIACFVIWNSVFCDFIIVVLISTSTGHRI